jgi:nucleotidyltransferase substrate binding protein (TIGR01987 family)
MKKLDNFRSCFGVLRSADFEMAKDNEIYRMGVIGQFNLTFELAWKALQAVLRLHGAEGADTGSPREILQLGYKLGFLDNAEAWLLMLKKRNTSVHIYNEDEADELLHLIQIEFIPAFMELEENLICKLDEAEKDWN